MKRIRLLLQKLVVLSRILSLLRLLLQRACADLRLSALQGGFLSALTKSGRLLRCSKTLSVLLLPNALQQLSRIAIGCAVCLLCAQIDALLLLSGSERLLELARMLAR